MKKITYDGEEYSIPMAIFITVVLGVGIYVNILGIIWVGRVVKLFIDVV